MNFLAHIYLSGDNEEIIIGNYIADSVKGKNYQNYSPGIQKGILLHRSIDHFTDEHLLIKEGKKLMRPELGKFAGAALDICLDHFLARDWHLHHKEDFRSYTIRIMKLLGEYNYLLPINSKLFFEYSKKTDRLYSYKDLKGIEEVFNGMHQRVKLLNNFNLAYGAFINNKLNIEILFKEFFPELKLHCKKYIEAI